MKRMVLFLMLMTPVFADKTLSVTLTDAKWTKVKEAVLAQYKKPSELEAAGVSDQKWVEKVMKMFLTDTVDSYDHRVRAEQNTVEKQAIIGEP